jgi:hypothetical protein
MRAARRARNRPAQRRGGSCRPTTDS